MGVAVHRAVLELILENDGGLFPVTEIARRAGVNPATIYRRWHRREALVLDVALQNLGTTHVPTQSGSLRDDLLGYARSLARTSTDPEGFALLRAVVTAAGVRRTEDDSGVGYLRERGAGLQVLLDAYGEAGFGVLDVFDVVLAPLFMRVLFDIGDVDDGFLQATVDRLMIQSSSA